MVSTMKLCLMVLLLAASRVFGAYIPPQCRAYRTIQDEFWRSLTYTSDESFLHSDSGLVPAWYRILPIQGTEGKSDLIWYNDGLNLFRCGTEYPIYLDASTDPLPKNISETTTVGLCIYLGDFDYLECVSTENDVQITNCGEFNVYKLANLGFSCRCAYCTSFQKRCPEGTFSETGFEPGCTDQVPKYTGTPQVEYSLDVDNSELVFICNQGSVELQNKFEHTRRIRWFMTRADDLTGRPTLVHEEKGSAAQVNQQLKESDWRDQFSLGVNIHCEIKGFNNEDLPGQSITSQEFFAGLQTLRSLITIKGNNNDILKISPTVPILCPKQFINGSSCTKDLEISVITRNHKSAACANGNLESSIIIPTTCGVRIKPHVPQKRPETDQTGVLVVSGRQPDIFNGNAASSLTLSVNGSRQEGFGIWTQKLPDVRVQVLNENSNTADKICSSNNDPHMTTFANRNYELQESGTFILYKHETLPLQVQAMYQQCYAPYTSAFCNCGIAVQSGKDVFIYDLCKKKSQNRVVQFLRVGVLGCDNKAMVIEKQIDGSYQIVLPTGTKIYVSQPFNTENDAFVSSIRLTASTSDYGFNTIGGVCGVIVPQNGTDLNDLKPKDGDEAIQDTKKFYKSWKVTNSTESLFLTPSLVDDDTYTLPRQCVCSPDWNHEVVCDATVAGTSCQIKDDETLLRVCKQGKRKKREILDQADLDIFADQFTYPEQDFDDSPPNTFKNGWTEQAATKFCNEYLTNNAPDECLALSNVKIESLKNGCVMDIKSIGTTDFALGNLGTLLRDCVIEVVGNNTVVVEIDPSEPGPSIANGSSKSTTTTTMKPISKSAKEILKKICPNACSMQGDCFEGHCQCRDGFSGADCSIDLNKPPSNLLLLSNGLCDLQSRSCQSTIVFGQDISTVRDVSCVINEYVFEDNNDHQNRRKKIANYRVLAKVMSAGQVQCTLKRTVIGRLLYAYDIALTNGGNVSESEEMIVFDSNCYSITENKLPILKRNVCVIDYACYPNNALNAENDQQFCKPGDSQVTWTVQPAPSNLRLPDNGVCDFRNGSCLTLVLSAHDISSLTGVSCVIKENVFQDSVDGHLSRKTQIAHYTVTASVISASQVRCTLRKTAPGLLVYAYDIAITNGGNSSESEEMLAFDSKCYSVNEDRRPSIKDDVCIIDSKCYAEGDSNPENDEDVCNPNVGQFGWAAKAPLNLRLFNDGSCDLQSSDCLSLFVYGQGISTVRDVTCVIEEYVFEDSNDHLDKKVKSGEYRVPATVKSASEARCDLPRVSQGRLVYAYEIALTNGGSNSESVELTVLNSKCYSTTENRLPKIKDDVCVIDSTCYSNGDLNRKDNEQHCQPESNQFAWTYKLPVITYLSDNGVCYMQEDDSECLFTFVTGRRISTHGDARCVIKEYIFQDSDGQLDRKSKTAEYTMLAIVISATKVKCTLRRTVPAQLVYVYDIALTNGADNSQSVEMIVFTSNCYSSIVDTRPLLESDVCVIDSGCYANLEVNPNDQLKICKPGKDQLSWSQRNFVDCYRLPTNREKMRCAFNVFGVRLIIN